MQWDTAAHAGFTAAEPWIAVNPNYTEINAKAQTADPDSVFHYYKKLITLRKQLPIIVYGSYELLLKDHEQIFAYTRTLDQEKLLVVCNFSDTETDFQIPEEFYNAVCLIANTERSCLDHSLQLHPYEAFVLLKQQ